MKDTRNYYGILFFLFFVHAIEEYLAQFFTVDPLIQRLSAQLTVTPLLLFLAVQVIWLGFLFSLAVISRKRAIPVWIKMVIGLVFLVELSHIVPAVLRVEYYPGLYTSLLIVLFGVYYWKALLRNKQ